MPQKGLPAIIVLVALAPSAFSGGLRLAEPAIDLGEVRAGVRLSRQVALSNDADVAVEILEVRGSCGCVAPRVEPRSIPPHGVAALHLSINTLGEGAGPHAWKVSIRYRQGYQVNDVELPLRAKIVTEITVQPASLTLVTEGGLTQTVVLTDLRAAPMKISRVATTADYLKAHLVEQGLDSRKTWTAKIQLEVGRDVPPGRHVEALSIYADDPLYGELRVPVTIVRPAARTVTADPPSVRFESEAEVTSQMIRIRAPEGQAIQVEKVQPAHDAIHCNWARGTSNDIFMRIQVDAARLGSVTRSRVEVHLSAPAREVITIPVLIGAGER